MAKITSRIEQAVRLMNACLELGRRQGKVKDVRGTIVVEVDLGSLWYWVTKRGNQRYIELWDRLSNERKMFNTWFEGDDNTSTVKSWSIVTFHRGTWEQVILSHQMGTPLATTDQSAIEQSPAPSEAAVK